MKIRLWHSVASVAFLALAGCGSSSSMMDAVPKQSSRHINNKVKFSSSAYGVAASPRVTASRKVRKGGGRRQIGKPYKVRGKWYTPREEHGYDKKGQASWYGPNFHGRLTANGEVYDQYGLSAAHPTFPLPSYARVTNTANGKSIVVRVNDRGPFHSKRIIDLSAKASELLDYQHKGIAQVRVQYIKQAPLDGLDHKQLMATYRSEGQGPLRQVASLRPSNAVGVDTMAVGSIGKPAAIRDPFLKALEVAKSGRDNGTTLSRRLNERFDTP